MSEIETAAALHSPGVSLPILPPCVHYAGNEKYIRKAFALQDESKVQFDVCCDLEDGAPRGGEEAQLRLILNLLQERSKCSHRVGVRIHDVQSAFWWTELRELLLGFGDKLAFLTLPKARGKRDVETLLGEIADITAQHNLNRVPPLHVLIETHGALEEVRSIAKLPGMQALEFGLMDFISEHQGAIPEECLRSPGQFENQLIICAKTEIAAAALGNGLVPVHNICLELNNAEQVRADAVTAQRFFGFLRMWSIHPSQIEPICEAFAPDFSQLEKAKRIIAEAQCANWAPIDFEGELMDRASYRFYWALLERTKMWRHGAAPSGSV